MTGTKRYLNELGRGEKGIVVDVETENCPESGKRGGQRGMGCTTSCASRWGAVRRLTGFGLTLGAEVTVTDSAPTDGSLEVSIKDRKITLGNEFASMIIVKTSIHGQASSRKNSDVATGKNNNRG